MTHKALPRVFVGTIEIAGMMHGITHCLRQQGFDADLHLFSKHTFGYDQIANNNPLFLELLTTFSVYQRARGAIKRARCYTLFFQAYQNFLKDAVQSYDVFIFNGFSSIFPDFSDLPILKSHGKRIITVLLGSDGRPPWMDGSFVDETTEWLWERTKHIYERMRILEQYCDCIVSHSPTSQFLSKPFVPFFHMGIPFPHAIEQEQITWPERPLILHAPSAPVLKGSALVRHAVEILKEERFDFDYMEITGQPNSVVLENLARCSFVVDQMYSDTLLAGLGTEAAHHAKPALVGSLPNAEQMMLGVEYMQRPPCETFGNEDPLPGMRRLLCEPEYARQLGKQAKDFVSSVWSIENIGQRLAKFVLGDIEKNLFCDPQDITFFRGCGLPEPQFIRTVDSYIKQYGHEALLISDKPQLLLALLRWLKRN